MSFSKFERSVFENRKIVKVSQLSILNTLLVMSFFWGHLKYKVSATPPKSLQVLTECRLITPKMLQNVIKAFENRLYYRMEVGTEHFEQNIY